MPAKQDYLNDAKWVNRVKVAFVTKDLSKNGHVTREDWLQPVQKAAQKITNRAAQRKTLEDATGEFMDVLGLGPGVEAGEAKLLDLVATMLANESTQPMVKMMHAWFDFLDTEQKGFLTLEDYSILLEANGIPDPDAAKAAFDTLEKSNEKKLEKEEYAAAQVKFWAALEKTEVHKLFGLTIN